MRLSLTDLLHHPLNEVHMLYIRQTACRAHELLGLFIKDGKVVNGNFRGRHGHGGIDENFHRRQAPLLHQIDEVIQQLLRAPHGKSGNHQITVRHRAGHNVYTSSLSVLASSLCRRSPEVDPNQQHIGFLHRCRVAANHPPGLPQVTTAHQFQLRARQWASAQPQLHNGEPRYDPAS